MSEIQLIIPKNDSAHFVFSYQGHTNIYRKVDLKKLITKTILLNGGSDLVSYTDSTIIFTGPITAIFFSKMRLALLKICNDFKPKVYCSLVMAHHSKKNNYIIWSGDKELNDGFQKVVDIARVELKLKP